ncbi:MAG: nitronate monooxygenase [Flavobacteriales bacterium]|nr:nitronate monooxygenase [Flavobacteriales bacterium]
MKVQTQLNTTLNLRLPIIQAGMVWCSGWKLAAASCIEGILGVIGAGSMYPDVLETQIQKLKKATSESFAVNLPLIYPQVEDHINIIFQEKVPVVISSAGNPNQWTQILKKEGVKVIHVVSNSKFAQKAIDAGVDMLITEGFEAGGHNGREEVTTSVLTSRVLEFSSVPVIAAGGIRSGKDILAFLAMGASGVQIGSAFVMASESSAHESFRSAIANSTEGDTELTIKALQPVRLLKNQFYDEISSMISNGANKEELKAHLGKGRAKAGMFLGDLDKGELEIGQVAAYLSKTRTVKEIINQLEIEFEQALSAFKATLEQPHL